MRRVIVESPFKGDEKLNGAYLVACLWDSIGRFEAPYASHLFFTQFMDDSNDAERALGIRLGLEIGRMFDLTAAYVDFGISDGMRIGIERAMGIHRPVEQRRLFLDTPTAGEISTLTVELRGKAIEKTGRPRGPF